MTHLFISIPGAEREFIELLNVLTVPQPKMNNDEQRLFWNYMDNPEPEDTVKMITQLGKNEATRWSDLAKQLMTLMRQLRPAASSETTTE